MRQQFVQFHFAQCWNRVCWSHLDCSALWLKAWWSKYLRNKVKCQRELYVLLHILTLCAQQFSPPSCLCVTSVHWRETGVSGRILWLMNQSVGSVIQQIALLLMLSFCTLQQRLLLLYDWKRCHRDRSLLDHWNMSQTELELLEKSFIFGQFYCPAARLKCD